MRVSAKPRHLVTVTLFAFLVLGGAVPADAVTPFVNEVADGSASDGGFFTSLDLDLRGDPHVSYQERTNFNLMYARKAAGNWVIEIADASANDVGRSTSLALDAQGNVHVAYQDETSSDLKYARRSGGGWTIEVVDAPNITGYYPSLALDAAGQPHVTYYDFSTADLQYARKTGGAWSIEPVDATANAAGHWPSLALDPQGNPHVSYYDLTNGDLKYARKTGGTWKRESADASANDLGAYSSLALDAQGNVYVSYADATTGNLKYARRSGGTWTREIADASITFLDERTSIAVDAFGNPHVSYPDGTNGDLKYARRSGSLWTIEVADGWANASGRYPSLVLDGQGTPHVSYWDGTVGDLMYADAAVHVLSPTGGVTWTVGSRQSIAWAGIGPVDVLISSDGGTTYQRLETGITVSPVPVRVSHLPTRFARVRIERTTPLSTAASDSFFTINATIALAKFDAARSEEGTNLTWETQPGPEADIRYRVERGSEGTSFISIADGLDGVEFVDQSPATASRYRLIAINGLGEEYVLGETSVKGALGADRDIVAYPNPASAPVEILYRVPLDRPMELSIYDLAGRKVRALISGRQAVGVQSVTWDRRDDAGRDVAAGTYFARLTSEDGFRATERVTIVR